MSTNRQIVAEGLQRIIRSLPDDVKVVVQLENLTREKFDALRSTAEATYLPRSEVWIAVVEFPANVFLEVETRESPVLRAVS